MATRQVDDVFTPDVQWREWVGRHPISGAALAGLIATQMATIVGYFLPGIGLPSLNWPAVNGALVVPDASPGAQFAAGAFVHTIDGVVFALLFAVLVWGRIPLPNTSTGNVEKGVIYGIVLAIISAGFLVPYVYLPKTGAGLFSFGYDDGWKLPAAILLWHLVYGFFLGTLYSPAAAQPASSDDELARAAVVSEPSEPVAT
jgi:hypothetical protein